MATRIRRWTSFGAGVGILALGLATIGWISSPPAVSVPDRGAADCLVNLTAVNRGNASITAVLATSQVRRRWGGFTWESWKNVGLSSASVSPGGTLRRSFSTAGRCDVQRQWRWKFKKGTNYYTHSATTEVEVGNTSMAVSLGDVNRFF
jgi:hypothetical protein